MGFLLVYFNKIMLSLTKISYFKYKDPFEVGSEKFISRNRFLGEMSADL